MSRRDPETRESIAREVDEELQFHIRMRAEENEKQGMDPARALREAERHFGDYERIARVSRYQRLAPRDPRGGGTSRLLAEFADSVRQDVVQAFRGFARAPGLFGAAVLTLAIGLGITTAIFSLANFALLRPVPGVADPGRLSDIWFGQDNDDGSFSPSRLSFPNFRDIVEHTTRLSGIAGYQSTSLAVAPPRGSAMSLSGHVVTDTYFEVLGVEPRIGRLFSSSADANAESGHVVISDRLWSLMFNRSVDTIGQTLRLNGHPYVISGVAAPGFHGPELLGELDIWIRGESYAALRRFDDPDRYKSRESGLFSMLIGRLAPDSTWDEAEAELNALGLWLAEQFPDANSRFAEVGFHVFRSFGAEPLGRPTLAFSLAMLMGVGGLVLLIACANVANLLTVRGLNRRGEVALRKALGAARRRVLRQHLIEGLLLWTLGALVGLGFAMAISRLLDGGRFGLVAVDGIVFDLRVVAFAALTALVVGIAFSIGPAAAALRVAPAGSLKETTPTGARHRIGARSVLTVVQLSASLVLLVGMMLLVRTLTKLIPVDPGFQAGGVYAVLSNPSRLGYSGAEMFDYYREFERRLLQEPAVEAVSVVGRAPLRCCGTSTRVRLPGDDESAILQAQTNTIVTPGFFELLRVPVLHGRTFTESEIAPPGGAAAPVVVVSESLARELFGAVNVVSRYIEFATWGRAGKTFEIIGVVADVRYRSLDGPLEPVIYEPAGLEPFLRSSYVLIRARTPADIAAISRKVAGQIDAALPVHQVVGLQETLARHRSRWTSLARLMSLLASFGAALAAVGIYGVVAFSVTARAREFGIRKALGSEPMQIFGLVLRSVTGMIAVGLLIGLAGSAAFVRILESYLYGVAPFDLTAWALASAGLVLVALLAASLPAHRATRVNPVDALRSQG